MTWHVNPDTGNAGKCSATKNCPFGGSELHFEDKYEAIERAEKLMSSKYALFDDLVSSDEYEEGRTYEDEYGRRWVYSSTPHISDPSRLEQKLAQEYWDEKFSDWTTGWLNPDEANGLCTDSAEAFTAWANARGAKSYVLDLNRDGGPHTVSVVETASGPMVVDFTARQFDEQAPVPFFEHKDFYIESESWEVTDEYVPSWT